MTAAPPTKAVRSVPLSVRVAPEDADFISRVEIAGAETPSEKVRALLAEARRRQNRNGPRLARTGVYIDDVFDPSPATRAGIQVGDSLIAVDGNRLYSVLDFQKWLYLSGVGRTVTLEIFRDGETREIDVTIELRPETATMRD